MSARERPVASSVDVLTALTAASMACTSPLLSACPAPAAAAAAFIGALTGDSTAASSAAAPAALEADREARAGEPRARFGYASPPFSSAARDAS